MLQNTLELYHKYIVIHIKYYMRTFAFSKYVRIQNIKKQQHLDTGFRDGRGNKCVCWDWLDISDI